MSMQKLAEKLSPNLFIPLWDTVTFEVIRGVGFLVTKSGEREKGILYDVVDVDGDLLETKNAVNL